MASSGTQLNPLLLEPEPYSPTPSQHVFPEQKGSRFKGFWKPAFWTQAVHEISADLWSTRWGRIFVWFLFYCWVASLANCLPLLAVLNSRSYSFSSACLPDGTFSIYRGSYNVWGISGFFQVTTRFGDFTFTQAKVIDVIWDIVSVLGIHTVVLRPGC